MATQYAIFRPATGMFIGAGCMVNSTRDSTEVDSNHVYDNKYVALAHIRYLYAMSTVHGPYDRLQSGERLKLITLSTTYKIV